MTTSAPTDSSAQPQSSGPDVELLLGGMTCASCANRVEKRLNKLDGVTAEVNYATEKASVTAPEGFDPQLLIADEPTSALDVTVQRQILDLIAGLVAERGMSMILISHDLGVIAENVERMMVMYGGTVVESGETNAVFTRMGHPYTQGLFRARPRLGARKGTRLKTIAGTVPELADLPAGCTFADRCTIAEARCRAALPVVVDVGAAHGVRCIRTDVSMAAGSVGA